MNDISFSFWPPGGTPTGAGRTFGCGAHGYVSDEVWQEPSGTGVATWPPALTGEPVAGTYEDVLAQMERIDWRPVAALILFSHARGIEPFAGYARRVHVRRTDNP